MGAGGDLDGVLVRGRHSQQMRDTVDNVETAHHPWIVNPAKVRGGDRDVDSGKDTHCSPAVSGWAKTRIALTGL
jgi:hypothetical protein